MVLFNIGHSQMLVRTFDFPLLLHFVLWLIDCKWKEWYVCARCAWTQCMLLEEQCAPICNQELNCIPMPKWEFSALKPLSLVVSSLVVLQFFISSSEWWLLVLVHTRSFVCYFSTEEQIKSYVALYAGAPYIPDFWWWSREGYGGTV
jgi:hypothetical protein